MGLNGGPKFKINYSVSFFVNCNSPEEVEEKWKQLTEGGSVMMPLNSYPWSPKYGWCQDKFGVNWQLMTGGTLGDEKIVPSLMFTNEHSGKTEEAINFYTTVFPLCSLVNMSEGTIFSSPIVPPVISCQLTPNLSWHHPYFGLQG